MAPGSVVVVGGHERKHGERAILKRFVAECGGPGCRVAVVGVASQEPEAMRGQYAEALGDLGALVRFLDLPDRSAAESPDAVEIVRGAHGIFFSGGDQLRITSILGGTRVESAIRARWRAGAVMAGTSAGASAMSATMIVAGREDATPTLNTIRMAAGLAFLPDAVVDQHFAQRGRIGRLLSALAQNPAMLGVGLDEDTALVVGPDQVGDVVGSNTVTFLDARDATETNASEAHSSPLALCGVRLHVLPAGYRFDLRERRALGGPAGPARAARERAGALLP